jgi:hypothetical protein
MRSKQPLRAAVTALALLSLPACEKEAETRTPAEGEPARRAAQSFVHCVEQGGANCVQSNPKLGAWDAFSMLGWLATGSPISILDALPRELQHHRDSKSVQRRFVEQVDRHRESLRGAECRTEQVNKLDMMLPKLQQAAQARLSTMGLWNADFQTVVGGLATEANKGLGGGYLISMRCQGDPWTVYVATTTEEQRQVVVGMLTALPEFLGGAAPSRDSSGRLKGKTLGEDGSMGVVLEGAVDAWITIPIEEF